MRPSKKIFGRKLKVEREAAYLTQSQVAEIVGFSGERVGQIEQSEVAGIDPSRLPQLAAALRLTVDELIKRIGAPENAERTGRRRSVLGDLRDEARARGVDERSLYTAMLAALKEAEKRTAKISDDDADDEPPHSPRKGFSTPK